MRNYVSLSAERPLQKVREMSKKKTKQALDSHQLRVNLGPFLTTLACLVPVGASAVFLVWVRVTTVQLGYELAKTQAALQALEEQNRVISTQVSSLKSPERLRELAKERFRLSSPTAEQVRGVTLRASLRNSVP